jgi:parallel beta-helix repeat protein
MGFSPRRRGGLGISLTVTAGIVGPLLVPLPAHAAVTCGQTITTSTTLTGPLHCPGRTALFIGASNVILNLGGHTVSGTQAPEGEFGFSGVHIVSNRTGVTVRNGTIRGFDRGVTVQPGATGALITGLTLDANELGIGVFTAGSALGGRIVNNTISNTTRFSGIQLSGHANRVEGNTFKDNASTAVFLIGSRNVVLGNTITGSGGNAVAIGPTPSTPGPFLANQISSNKISGSARVFTSSSISLNNGEGTRVEGNTIVGRGTGPGSVPGVFVNNSANTVVSGNRVSNQGVGVFVRGGSAGTQLVRNMVERNGTGLTVSSFGDGPTPTATLVDGNTASDNGFDGIQVSVASATVKGNLAYRNGNLGISAVNGVTDGGGNRAFGNGNPQQCSPSISCS